MLFSTLGFAKDVVAQSHPIFDATGLQAHRDYFSQLPFEHVDPVSGAVVLTFTDLVLPGSAGRDLVFQRTYNSKGQFGGAPGRWAFGIAGVPLWIEDTWPLTPEWSPLLHYADGGAAAAATPLYPMVGGNFGPPGISYHTFGRFSEQWQANDQIKKGTGARLRAPLRRTEQGTL